MTRIEKWKIVPALYGSTHISGKVYDHPNPRHEDGKIITSSPIISIDTGGKICRTRSGNEYVLGEPATPNYRCPFTNEETDAFAYLVKRVHEFLDGQQEFKRLKASKKLISLRAMKEPYPIYRNDVLIKCENGGYTKLTGICMVNLPILDDEVESWDRVVCLSMW